MLAHVTTSPGTVTADPWSVALVVLVWGVAALVVGAALAGRAGRLRGVAVPFALWSATIAAGLSLGAAAIHFAAIGDHFAEYPPYGIAFAALAWFQVGWAIACLFMPGRSVAVIGVVVNLGALLTWAASRTVGLPFGPEPGQVEPVGPLDVVASALEIALVGVLAWDLGAIGGRIRPALSRAGAVMVIGSSALVVVLLTTTAFAAAGGDAHGGADHEPPPIGAVDAPSALPSVPPATTLPGPAETDSSMSYPVEQPTPLTPPSPSGAAPSISAGTSPTAVALPSASPRPQPTPERSNPTPPRATARPTQRPTPTTPSTTPGAIRFGTSLDQDGEIATPASQFGEGQTAVWIADFIQPPNAATVRMFIVQVLPDGREFEHWREDIPVDPAARRLVGRADLSIYLHGGDGRHLMRYMRGDTLLAEGAFDLVR